ncbi:response regulator [Ornithinibacillus caprae]|uniref:response regulator n=1 Tax=Ornithinibacillus caprae TaxID=2678566 RepID=UPI0018C56386|nr:response regulator [Ornithinibacillus caprae]
MKIRTKLLLALSTLPILILITIGIGRFQLANFYEISSTLQDNYDLSVVANTINTDLKDEAISLRNILMTDDENIIQHEISSIQIVSERIMDNLSLLESKAYTPEQEALVNDLIETNEKYNTYQDQILQLVTAGENDAATALMQETSQDFHSQFMASISEILTTFEAGMNSTIATVEEDFSRSIILQSVIIAVSTFFILLLLFRTVWLLSSRLNKVSKAMNDIANENIDLDTRVEVSANDEIGEVAQSFNQLAAAVEEKRKSEKELIWTKSNIADVTSSLTGAKSVETLLETFLSKVIPLVNGSHAVFYVKEELDHEQEPVFKLRASYAFQERKHMTNEIHLGEGLIGQAALEKTPIILSHVPSDYVSIKSGLGEAPPLNLYVVPILFENDVKAVLEIASFESFSESERSVIEELSSDLGIMLESVIGRYKLAKALEESQTLMEEIQAQSEELQTQQDELKTTNEELEQQTIALRESEEKLQMQQEELEQTNVELEEKANDLEEQNKRFEEKNQELEQARMELEERAKQLALSSKYKSEFLANMSHELRTPLNSMLILSNLLSENTEGALSPKQVEYANTIYSSGRDLLALINDILDLSKIESGKMDVHTSHVHVHDLAEFVESNFRPVADKKNVQFHINYDNKLPETIYSDEIKIQQVLKNLLSNAFKFTKKGEVTLEITKQQLIGMKPTYVFSVHDTGIGISKENQELIFDAFQQADGTTSRKYGGTGLGLSISKEIASLLGGSLTVDSEEGKGSTFTFYVTDYDDQTDSNNPLWLEELAGTVEPEAKPPQQEIKHEIITQPEQATKLIVEENSHIKRLLIVDDDLVQRNSLLELVGEMNVIIKAVSTGSEAIKELTRTKFDCVVLDLGLTDTTGFELLEEMMELEKNDELKVIVYTGRDLTSKEERYLNKYTHTIIIKDQHSPQRLKEELKLFLVDDQQETDQMSQVASQEEIKSTVFSNMRALIVDDDVRNVYALSSILEVQGMDVSFAENGLEGLEMLKSTPGIDIVLMDIMMPEMDGYEAITRIREIPSFKELPIIALTAKAMIEDREKCLAAGASDYIVKPINPEQLISLIKVWLFNQDGKDN